MKNLSVLLCATSITSGCMAQPSYEDGEGPMMVFQKMRLVQDEDGVSPGFDLDGYNGTARDARGCNQVDFESPTGLVGVDNQLGSLIPLLDLVGDGLVDFFIQNAIDEGRLLVMPKIERRDGRLDLTIYRGADTPLLGTDGFLLPEQTIGLSEDRTILGRFEGVSFEDNVLKAGPFDLNLPVLVFDILYDIHLRNTYFELRLDENGRGVGVLSGGAGVQELLYMAEVAGDRAAVDLISLIGNVIQDIADLERDSAGDCQAVSTVAVFETVAAYTFTD